jgi:hypothetical protein
MKSLLKIFAVLTLIVVVVSSCKKDPCDDISCLNGGTCNDGTCACAEGYEGTTCATEERAKFLSTYSVNESCTSGPFEYSISISTSSSGVSNVIIPNFGGYGVTVAATVNNSSINIPNQTLSDGTGASATFSGSGQISGNILTITYNVSFNGGGSDACTMTCTKL